MNCKCNAYVSILAAVAPWPALAAAPPESSYSANPAPIVGEDGTLLTPTWSGRSRSAITIPALPGTAGAADVAIVASASGDVTDPLFTDPQNKLLDSGFFSSVTVIHAGLETPELVDLLAFDAVLVWSNFDFENADALGDRLADYVDAGGGVVNAVFSNSSAQVNRYLGGRWLAEDYNVITALGGNQAGPSTLGTIFDPGHQLVTGLSTFDGGTLSARPVETGLNPAAALVADWADGKPLITYREDLAAPRADLGMYPPSDDVSFLYWDASTDGDRILANALVYTAQQDPTDVAIQLIPRFNAGTVDTTNDPQSLPGIMGPSACAESFVVEIWLSDVGAVNTGVLGMYLDIIYNVRVIRATGIVHTPLFPDGFFAEGTIDNVNGQITNFGSFNFDPQGIEPVWARLGYIRFRPVGHGSTTIFSTPGLGEWAVANRPPPAVSEIDFGSATVRPRLGGDFDFDCQLDLIDFSLFQSCFDQLSVSVPCTPADIDKNEIVDLEDFREFYDELGEH